MDIKLKKELRSISLTDNTDICALYFGEFGESYSNVADKRYSPTLRILLGLRKF